MLVSKIRDRYKLPALNKVAEIIRCEQFAKDADEFMEKSGEDNIFRSAVNWMIPQVSKDSTKPKNSEAEESKS